MGSKSGADGGRTYEVTFALTDTETELFTRLSRAKLVKIAPFGDYIVWINLAAGGALSITAGAIALRYYGLEPGPNASTLVMALFSFFLAGTYLYRWLLRAWFGRAYAHRTRRYKETQRIRLSGDGITHFARDWEIRMVWTSIEDVTFTAGNLVLWTDPDNPLLIPLRAVSPSEERALLVDAVKCWTKSVAASPARPEHRPGHRAA
jgi:hypothetical protein